jgi:hypothetical protein
MASTRIPYDECAFKEEVTQSVIPGLYHLYDGQYENKDKCIFYAGPRNTRTYNSSEVSQVDRNNLVDVDSILSGRNVPLTRCMEGRKMEDLNKQCDGLKIQNPLLCSDFLLPTETRYSHPAERYKAMPCVGCFPLEYPMIDPKEFVFWGHNGISRDGLGTRNYVKDNYTEKTPNVINDINVRPQEGNIIQQTECPPRCVSK